MDVSSLALGVRDGLMRLPLEQNIITGSTAASLTLRTSWENYNLNGNAIFVSFPPPAIATSLALNEIFILNTKDRLSVCAKCTGKYLNWIYVH